MNLVFQSDPAGCLFDRPHPLPPQQACCSTSTPWREGNSGRISWCKRKVIHCRGHWRRQRVMVTFLSVQVHLLSFFYSVQFMVLDVGTAHVDKP